MSFFYPHSNASIQSSPKINESFYVFVCLVREDIQYVYFSPVSIDFSVEQQFHLHSGLRTCVVVVVVRVSVD